VEELGGEFLLGLGGERQGGGGEVGVL